ncbi:MAG: rSAM-modified peptide [Candidatus Aminicenantes bacterium]|nr:rSAM-modified peptide [Candidatus Aminicenantes bacterium]
MVKKKKLNLLELSKKELGEINSKDFVGGAGGCICEGGGGVVEQMRTEKGTKPLFAFFETMVSDSVG